MGPKSTNSAGRGRPKARKTKVPVNEEPESSNPFDTSSDERARRGGDDDGDDNDDDDDGDGDDRTQARTAKDDKEEPEKTIPRDLMTRLLHEFFAKDSTRISRDANAAAGKYMDIFVREAIARASLERQGGFLEVEDLEKIAPQLLLDL
ncbi:Centromere protein X [Escovopsis weberi]|uniref:Centromere protein X n=1 Tax=Escovopsis weberi TaxID=150374 RepID=A0A0N0RU18_ESCWE|nr:Centromere protein X [Escovopsis weberi]